MKKIFALLFCLVSLSGFAQKATDKAPPHTPSVQIIGVYYGDSVILRWAPSSWQVWQAGISGGYVIERYEMDLPADYLTQKDLSKRKTPTLNKKSKKKLSPDPIKPLPAEVWKAKFDNGDTLSAMAAHLIYGQTKDALGTKDVTPGALLTAMNEQKNLYGMVLLTADRSAEMAKGMGLSFVDKSVEKNKSYFYKVYIHSDISKVKFDSAGTVIQTFHASALPHIPAFKKEEKDHKIVLSWDRQIAAAYFTSYVIERSDDGGKTFASLTKPIFTPMFDGSTPDIFWSDSVPQNYKAYQYKITGITPFGIKGKPGLVNAIGRDRTPPSQPQNIKAINTEGTIVEITWDKNTDSDLNGYFVGKSNSLDGPFVPLSNEKLSVKTTSFKDEKASSLALNYYIVAAIDTAGNTIASLPAYAVMTDTTAPAQPKGLKALVDKKGMVQLSWTTVTDPDLAGYLVYGANDSTHAFSSVSKEIVPVNAFIDTITLHSLTEKRYYKVVALDKHKNVSAPSVFTSVLRPDTIAPVQPVFNDFKVTENSVKLFWNKSSSNDVVKQILFRKEADGAWMEIKQLDKNTAIYVDDSVKAKVEYEYAVSAIDDAGNMSLKSYPLKARAYGKSIEIKEKPVLTYNKDKQQIEVSWKADLYSGQMLIYRNFNGQGLVLYKSADAEKGVFTDVQLNGNGTYEYAIKVQMPDGSTSLISKMASTTVK